MRDRCDGCSVGVHCIGKGTYELFDQDGPNHYVCQCCCGNARKARESAKYDLAPLIRRHGKELLLEVLSA